MDPKNKVEDGRLVRPKAPERKIDRPKRKRKPPMDDDYGVVGDVTLRDGAGQRDVIFLDGAGNQVTAAEIVQMKHRNVELAEHQLDLRVRIESLERQVQGGIRKHPLRKFWEFLLGKV